MKKSVTATLAVAQLFCLGIVPSAHAETPSVKAGERIFASRCQACHSVSTDGKSGPIAPNLRGVVGRKAASTSFRNYSQALAKSDLIWTQSNLQVFLAAPTKTVPGTRMVVAVPNAADSAALIAFLESLK